MDWFLYDKGLRHERVKHEIRTFSIHFPKDIARNMKTERSYWENKLKTTETSNYSVDNPEHTEANETLVKIYQEKTNGIRIRSKCDWYKHEENFFSKYRKILCSSKPNPKNLNR